jgi:hypothetical protein
MSRRSPTRVRTLRCSRLKPVRSRHVTTISSRQDDRCRSNGVGCIGRGLRRSRPSRRHVESGQAARRRLGCLVRARFRDVRQAGRRDLSRTVDAGRGGTLTSYPSIRTDLRNAGANVVDEEVALDGNVIPADHRMICRRSARRSSGNSGKLRWAPEYYGEVSRFCFMGMNEPKVVIATAFTKLERPP